jgi:hypothetical protein
MKCLWDDDGFYGVEWECLQKRGSSRIDDLQPTVFGYNNNDD